MNKSYRNVFCLKTGTYVAAPETAASRGKKSSRAVIAAAVVAVIGAMLPLSEAGAQTTITAAVANSGTIVPIGSTITQTTTNPKVTGWGALAAGNAAVANGNGATAMGNGAQAIGDKALAMGVGASATKGSSIAIGTNAQSNETLTVAVGANAITTAGGGTALGSNTTAGYLGTALGYGSTTGTTSSSVALGYASVADRDNSVSVGSSSTKRQIINVAAGTLGNDAVNVNQLKGITTALGGGAGLDASGNVIAPGYTLTTATGGTTTASNVGDALKQLDGRVAGNTTNVTNLLNGTAGLVQQASNTAAITVGKATGGTSVSFVAPTYTVNNAQYSNVNDALQSLATNIATVQQAPAVVQKVETTTTNSAFASNGDQANAATATGSNAVAIGAGASASAGNSVAIGAGSVADRANTVSVGSVGNERAIANVADAVADTDAVNKRQLDAVQSSNQAYTDARADQLQNDIASVKRDANGAAASAMAVAGLPQSITPGASMASVAASTMDGESAIAVGVSKVSDNARWITKISGTVNSRGKAGATVGIGFQF